MDIESFASGESGDIELEKVILRLMMEYFEL